MMSGVIANMVIIPILSSILVLALCGCGLLPITQAANFTITNNCPETVWAAWYSSASGSGGRELNSGNKVWLLDVAAGTAGGRIWGRTGCNFDGSGNGPCATGGCADKLICTTTGAADATLAEFSLNQAAAGGAVVDYYDISVVDGFNVAMGLGPTNPKCGSPKCGASDCPGANSRHNNSNVHTCPSQGTNYAITFCPS